MFPRNYDSALRFRVDGEVHVWELNRLLINGSYGRGLASVPCVQTS
jgi:hypothetical protein